jgi:hypothetical protein
MLAASSLESVQSCLLMASYLLPLGGAGSCYVYIRLAMQMAISQGLHQADAGKAMPPAVREVQNRVFWTTYIIERYGTFLGSSILCTNLNSRIAGDLGYNGVIQISEIECPPPQKCPDWDGIELSQIDRLMACRELLLHSDNAMQSRYGNFTKPYLGDKLKESGLILYCRRCGSRSVDFRGACSRLRSWKRNLDSDLQSLDGWSLRANAHLQIQYHLCWTYLGRDDLIQIVQSYLNNERRGSDGEPHESSGPSITLSTSCVDSAYTIIELIDLLRQQEQLAKFSHTDLDSCGFATTIILLDSIVHPSSEAGLKVATGMQVLRYMASDNSKALNSLRYIEALLHEINEVLARFHGRTRCGSPVTGSPDQSSSGGTQFGASARDQQYLPLDTRYDSGPSRDFISERNFVCAEAGPYSQGSISSTLDAMSDARGSDMASFSGFSSA